MRTVDPAKLRAAQSLGAPQAQLIRHVILPSALPEILTGVRIGLAVVMVPVVLILVTVSATLSGALALLAVLGLFIIPTRRKQARQDMSNKVAELRQHRVPVAVRAARLQRRCAVIGAGLPGGEHRLRVGVLDPAVD